MHFLCLLFQQLYYEIICFFLITLNVYDKTLPDINWNNNLSSTILVILLPFTILSLLSCLISDDANDRYRLLTHRLLFIPPSIAQLLKTLMRYDQLLFKNKVIVTIPSSLTTPLLSLTLELEKILLTLTNY